MHYGHSNDKRHFFIDVMQLHLSDSEIDLGVLLFFYRSEVGKSSFDCNFDKAHQMMISIQLSSDPCFGFGDSDMIERVQRRATKLIQSTSYLDYNERLEALSLSALFERRQQEDAIHMHTFIHGIDEIDKASRFQVIKTKVRGHSPKYDREISKKKHNRNNFFFNLTEN